MAVFDKAEVQLELDLGPFDKGVAKASDTLTTELGGAMDKVGEQAATLGETLANAMSDVSFVAAFDDLIDESVGAGAAVKKSFGDAAAESGGLLDSINPDFAGILSSAKSAASGLLSTFGKVGGSIASAMGSVVSKVGDTFMAGMRGAGLAAGGLLATSLVTGYGRYTTIQDSVAALTVSLGSAAEAGGLLDDVIQVVTGTPFNLDQFADAAQRMSSFGVEAEKIPGYLTAIGEVAATKGGRANEFAQRLATNFAQVAAMGKITGAEIRELAIAGVPAIKILANEFGVTTDVMQDMVSKGAVPATEALDALERGILNGTNGLAGVTPALAGTMEGLRDSLSGATGGLKSASARFGATIIEALAPALTALAQAGAAVYDGLGDAIGPAINAFSNLEPIQNFIEVLGDLNGDMVSGAVKKLGEFKNILVPLGAAASVGGIGALGGLLGPLAPILTTLGGPLGMVIAGFAGLVAVSDPLKKAFAGIPDAFAGAFDGAGALVDTLQSVMDTLADSLAVGVEAAGPAIAGAVEGLFAVIEPVADLLGNVLVGGIEAFAEGVAPLGDVFADLGESVGGMVEQLWPLSDVVGSLVTGAFALVTPILEGITGLFDELASSGALEDIALGFSNLADGISAFAGFLGDALGGMIEDVGPWISDLVSSLGDLASAAGRLLESDLAAWFAELVAFELGFFISAIAGAATVVADLATSILNIGMTSDDFEAALDADNVKRFANAINGASTAVAGIGSALETTGLSDFFAGTAKEMQDYERKNDSVWTTVVGKVKDAAGIIGISMLSPIAGVAKVWDELNGGGEAGATQLEETLNGVGVEIGDFIDEYGKLGEMDVPNDIFAPIGISVETAAEAIAGGLPGIAALEEELLALQRPPGLVAVAMDILKESLIAAGPAMELREAREAEENLLAMQNGLEEVTAGIEGMDFDQINIDAFQTALEQVNNGVLDSKINAGELNEAFDELGGATEMTALGEGIEGLRLNLDNATDAGRANLGLIQNLAGEYRDGLSQAMIDSGGDMEVANQKRQEFNLGLAQSVLGIQDVTNMTDEESRALKELQVLAGSDNESWEATVELAGAEAAKEKLALITALLGGFGTKEEQAFIALQILDDDAEGAIESFRQLAEGKPVNTRVDLEIDEASEAYAAAVDEFGSETVEMAIRMGQPEGPPYLVEALDGTMQEFPPIWMPVEAGLEGDEAAVGLLQDHGLPPMDGSVVINGEVVGVTPADLEADLSVLTADQWQVLIDAGVTGEGAGILLDPGSGDLDPRTKPVIISADEVVGANAAYLVDGVMPPILQSLEITTGEVLGPNADLAQGFAPVVTQEVETVANTATGTYADYMTGGAPPGITQAVNLTADTMTGSFVSIIQGTAPPIGMTVNIDTSSGATAYGTMAATLGVPMPGKFDITEENSAEVRSDAAAVLAPALPGEFDINKENSSAVRSAVNSALSPAFLSSLNLSTAGAFQSLYNFETNASKSVTKTVYVNYVPIGNPPTADGGIFPFIEGGMIRTIAEAGDEAVIPMDRPGRALELLEASGLADLVRGSSSGSSSSRSAALVTIGEARFEAGVDLQALGQTVAAAYSLAGGN